MAVRTSRVPPPRPSFPTDTPARILLPFCTIVCTFSEIHGQGLGTGRKQPRRAGQAIALCSFRHNLPRLGGPFIARALALAEPRRGQQHSRNHARDPAPVGGPRRCRHLCDAGWPPALSAQRDRVARAAAAQSPPRSDRAHRERIARDARLPPHPTAWPDRRRPPNCRAERRGAGGPEGAGPPAPAAASRSSER